MKEHKLNLLEKSPRESKYERLSKKQPVRLKEKTLNQIYKLDSNYNSNETKSPKR